MLWCARNLHSLTRAYVTNQPIGHGISIIIFLCISSQTFRLHKNRRKIARRPEIINIKYSMQLSLKKFKRATFLRFTCPNVARGHHCKNDDRLMRHLESISIPQTDIFGLRHNNLDHMTSRHIDVNKHTCV